MLIYYRGSTVALMIHFSGHHLLGTGGGPRTVQTRITVTNTQ